MPRRKIPVSPQTQRLIDELRHRLRDEDDAKERIIARTVKDQLETKLLPTGSSLSVSVLSRELGLARNTISSAFSKLVDDGVLKSQPAMPYVAVRPKPLFPEASGEIFSIDQWAAENKIQYEAQVIHALADMKRLTGSPDVRMALENNDRSVASVVRVWKFRGRKEREYRIGIIESAFATMDMFEDLTDFYSNERNSEISFHAYVKMRRGIVAASKYRVAAGHLPEEIKNVLSPEEVTEGSWLCIQSTLFSDLGASIHIKMWCPGDGMSIDVGGLGLCLVERGE